MSPRGHGTLCTLVKYMHVLWLYYMHVQSLKYMHALCQSTCTCYGESACMCFGYSTFAPDVPMIPRRAQLSQCFAWHGSHCNNQSHMKTIRSPQQFFCLLCSRAAWTISSLRLPNDATHANKATCGIAAKHAYPIPFTAQDLGTQALLNS